MDQDSIEKLWPLIGELTLRAFMDRLRASGVDTGGPSAISQRDRQLFAKHLDYYLTNLVKQKDEKA